MATKAAPAPNPTANGVAWNFTPPPVTTFAPGIGADLGQAVLNAPLYNAEQTEQMAQTQAGTAQAQAATIAAQQAADNEQWQRLAPFLRAKPDLINTPQVKAVLGPILARWGMPYPTLDAPQQTAPAPAAGPPPGDAPPVGGAGSGNAPPAPTAPPPAGMPANGAQPQAATSPLAALFSMFAPPQQTFQELSGPEQQEYVNKERLVDPKYRTLMPGAPDWLKDATQVVPLTGPGVQHIIDDLTNKLKLLTSGKTYFTPAMYFRAVKQAQAQLRAGGAPGDADALNTQLSADGNSLSDDFKAVQVGEAFKLEQQKLDAAGIHLRNEDQYREEREKDLKAEFDGTLQFKYANLSREEKRDVALAQASRASRDESMRKFNARMEALKTMDGQLMTTRTFGVYKQMLAGAQSQLGQLQKHFDDISGKIQAWAQVPSLRRSPMFNDMLAEQADALKTLNAQKPILQAREQQASGAMAQMYTTISGNPAYTVPDTQPSDDDQTETGDSGSLPPTQVRNGKTYYLNADGKYYLTP